MIDDNSLGQLFFFHLFFCTHFPKAVNTFLNSILTFFFALKQKRTKKDQGKGECLPAALPATAQRLVIKVFSLYCSNTILDVCFVSVTFPTAIWFCTILY